MNTPGNFEEQDFQAAMNRLLFHMENSPLGFIEWDNTLQIKSMSKRAEEIFGWTVEEFNENLKTGYNQVYHEDLPWVSEIAKQLINGQIERNTIQHRNVCKNGKIIWCQWHNSVLKDKEGKVFTIMSLIKDITIQKHAELDRIKMTEDLIKRNNDLEQFSYIVSHNLRVPVANMLGAFKRINDERLTAEQKEMLQDGIYFSLSKLDDIIKDLNKILELRSDLEHVKEIIRFADLVKDIKSTMSWLKEREDIEIRCNFSEVEETIAVKSYLYSIFYNLISNSIKYRKVGEHCIIDIRSFQFENKVKLVFKDNGTGINLEKSGRDIFGLYKRFHTNIEGKGMGLYMVKTQVEKLGGTITVSSEVNAGTEFTIILDNEYSK